MKRVTSTAVIAMVAVSMGLGMVPGAKANDWGKGSSIILKKVMTGSDLNNTSNPTVQPQDPAQSGGGRDQTQQFGDILEGTKKDDFLIGRLGTDIMWGNRGNDILIGGTEDFNPFNRDRAFGGLGNDIFMWAPGDGSDYFNGGPGHDVLMLGLIGEVIDGNVQFKVSLPGTEGSQDSDKIFFSPYTKLPLMDLTNSPGFCEVIDESNAEGGKAALDALGLDHLVKFFIRAAANNGSEDGDNGLRVTIHLKDVEFLVCTNRDGQLVEITDLRKSPPRLIDVEDIPSRSLRRRLEAIIQ